METKPDNEFTKQYPKTARGIFKRVLFWITILCSISAIALMIMYPYDKVQAVVMPPIIIAVVASLVRVLMNKQDKKRNAN
jgi:amino acid permease